MFGVFLKGLWVSVCDEFFSFCYILRGESVLGSKGDIGYGEVVRYSVQDIDLEFNYWVWILVLLLICLVILSKL